MNKKYRYIISNDDGYGAPGVVALQEVLLNDAIVWYSLPDRDRSGASQSLTLHRPIKVVRHDAKGIVVEGTPADCVRLGVSGLCDFEPDYVLSGINSGANMGTDVLYSGTVAAAMEAVAAGVPAIAFSLDGTRYFNSAAAWVSKILACLAGKDFPQDLLLNVNVPDMPISAIKGCRITRLGRRDFVKNLERTADPRNKERYWIGLPGDPSTLEDGTDFKAVADGYVSITPLTFGRFSSPCSSDTMGLLSDLLVD